MMRRALVTGGAGFIGSHLVDELLEQGWQVRCLDSLTRQVHESGRPPSYLSPEAELVVGDVRDADAVRRALAGVDTVFHLAAAVGVGQSMFQPAEYTSVNNLGTATLLEQLIEAPIRRLVVASSMSVYGEGLYEDEQRRPHEVAQRKLSQLRMAHWDPVSAEGGALHPIPTPESKSADLASVYALSKFDQERMCLLLGRAYQIPTVALRFFNVYGPRQALSNPYTGVLAIFASRFLNEKPPLIFEDGAQLRDFVHAGDVARACRLAAEASDVEASVINIGSGRATSILDVAAQLKAVLGSNVSPRVTGEYRVGDVRHCTADISRAKHVLGYQPRVTFGEGLGELAEWLQTQTATDRVDEMHRELAERGLTL